MPSIFLAKTQLSLQFSKIGKTKPVADVLYPGHHGYDPLNVKEMRTIMYATGPQLKSSYVSKPLLMTDHYNLICFLLNIEAQPNNGSWLRVQDMIKSSEEVPFQQPFCHIKSHADPMPIRKLLIFITLIVPKLINCLNII